ncbi:MoxR family ATPase [uncultured Fusobacterium sp.]|uniref:AAA family ATPase n=1 Tax=uncultured Fusobacterium sp. TaxID=159267 RepID=UPI0025DC9317|nr:MoxR family ATPase [uncultured Fusobacterium sp.]
MENLKEKILVEKETIATIKREIEKKIVGQEDMIRKILIGIFTGNHILLEGLPGLAKSLTVNTIAQTLGLKFSRIQFTPDLLPSDIIGTEIYNEKTGEFYTKKGPIFANIVLADEINRAPAKVQSALLEAMQEKQITIANETFKLDRPFIVLATQNPIEQDGTYPLPEAQQDRFLMKVKIEYPTKQEEKAMLNLLTTSTDFDSIKIEEVLNREKIETIKEIIKNIHIDEKLMDYILEIVFKTRETNYIACGASPRASIALVVSAKANAFLEGREYIMPQDIKRVIFDVLRHRIMVTYEAEAEGKNVEDIITGIMEEVKLP